MSHHSYIVFLQHMLAEPARLDKQLKLLNIMLTIVIDMSIQQTCKA